jgi:hypothetical protein
MTAEQQAKLFRDFTQADLMLRQVKPAMERGDEWCRLTGKQGERIVVEMEVQQIEIASPLAISLEHGHVQCIWVADRAVQTQGLRPTCFQVGRSLRIAAREQDDFMPKRDQFVRQP